MRVMVSCGEPSGDLYAASLTRELYRLAPGTTVTARVRCGGPAVVLEIEDDGPGIPPALLPHIFERFARGDASRSRHAGSTGLGLAIVDAVVTAHGGRVGVRSEPGRTVFGVQLPAWNAAFQPQQEMQQGMQQGPRQSVAYDSQTEHRHITQP